MKNTLANQLLERVTFKQKILAYFFAVVLLLTSVIVLYSNVSREYKINNDWVKRTEAVLSQLDTIISLQKQIVIDTRAFIITGDTAFFATYAGQADSVARKLSRLKALAQTERFSFAWKLDSLAVYIGQYSQVRQEAIAQRQQSSFALEKEIPLVYKSEQSLAMQNRLFHSIREEVLQLLLQRRKGFQASAMQSVWFIRILLLLFTLSFVVAVFFVYRNTAQRNRAEAALQKNRELIRAIIDHAPVLINVKDLNGCYLLANKQFAEAVQLDEETMNGKSCTDVLPPETAALIRQADNDVMHSLQQQELLVNIPGYDGMQTYLATKFPLTEEGRLYAIGSSFVDITPIKRAHEALEKSYQHQQKILNGLQEVLSASSDLICIINENNEFVMVSDTVSQLLGYRSKELMSKKFIDFVADEDKAATLAIASEIMSGQTATEFLNHYRTKEGMYVPLIWSAKWLPEDKLMYCIARNGSEKIKKALELSQSQSRLAHAQKIAKLGNWDWDIWNGRWSCSDEIYNLLGLEKAPGQDMQKILLRAIHPADRKRVMKARREAFTLGKNVDVEHRIIRPDRQICFVHTKGEVHYDLEKRPVWFSGTMQDITDRKQVELNLQQLNKDLEKRAKELKASNAELERFAYVASHDLQEPLRMVTSFLGLLQKKLGPQLDESSRTYIHYAVDGAERMKVLIQDLLHYSRLGTSAENLAPVDLNSLVADVLRVFDGTLKENGAVVLTGSLPVVVGHKTQLQQLFQNLVGNAVKYRRAEPPRVEIGCREEGEDWLFFVRDNGIGIDPKYFEKIFILFQRLHPKSEYGGTGMGLAICKKIVERHGGRIWVDSEPANGSTFFFTIKKHNHV